MAKEEFNQTEDVPENSPTSEEPAAAAATARRKDNSSSPYLREKRRSVRDKHGNFVGSDSPLAAPRTYSRKVISPTFARRALNALDLSLEGVTDLQTRLRYRLDSVRMSPPKRREGESDDDFRERERKWDRHTFKMWRNSPTRDYGYDCLRGEFSARIEQNDPTLTEEELITALRKFYESRLENG